MADSTRGEMINYYIQTLFTQQLKDTFVKDITFDEQTASELYLLLDEFIKESTRARPVFVADMLDKKLAKLLQQYLIGEGEQNIRKDSLLGDFRPIQSFASRITLAYRIGLIDDLLSNELRTVNTIRRTFAHNWMADDFDKEAIDFLKKSIIYSHHLGDNDIKLQYEIAQNLGIEMKNSEWKFLYYILILYTILTAIEQIIEPLKKIEIYKNTL